MFTSKDSKTFVGIMKEVAHSDLVFKKTENLEKCAKACEEYGLKDVFSPGLQPI